MKNFDNKQEKSLVLIKPDGIQRGLIGEIIKRYERCGLKLIALKMLIPTPELAEKHYLVDPEFIIKNGTKVTQAYIERGQKPPFDTPKKVGQNTLNTLKTYLSCGPTIAMIWQGMNAIGIIRKITGSTEPLASQMGTIRGDYTIDSYKSANIDGRALRTIIHASGSVEEAEKEIPIWFKKNEILSYRLIAEEVLYDVNLDGILE